MRKLLFGLCCWAVIHIAPVLADSPAPSAPRLNCMKGPVTKSYGGSDWLVYGCDDSRTLVVLSAPGNPAAPFYFTLYPKVGGYQLVGEGTGSKAYSDAASKELSSLSLTAIQTLLTETGVLSPQPSPEKSLCKDTLPITVENLSGIESETNGSYSETTHYYDDGSFSGKIIEDGKISWLFSGTWKLEGHTMKSVYTFSSLDRVPVGTTDSDEIIQIGCGSVVYRSNSGMVRSEKLVKP